MNGPSPEPEREPTPEEWVDWFLQLPRVRQLEIASYCIGNSAKAMHCWAMNHEGQIENLRFALAQRDREFDQLARCGTVASS